MTKQMLRGIRVNTKQELKERIYQYFEEVNREPVVYHWKYKKKAGNCCTAEVLETFLSSKGTSEGLLSVGRQICNIH